jgi:hypothetical protein
MVNWIKDNIIEVIVIMIIAAITVFIIIAACVNESHRISEGTVVDRHYTAGYTSVATKDRPATYHPPRCTLTISGTKDGEYVEYTFEVPEAEYAKYNIGDHYPKED